MSETLIKVEGVSKKFCRSLKKSLWYGMQDLTREVTGRRHGGNGELRTDEFWAVNDVSFELKRGECLGLIGRNGAGKTTLLRMLNGLIKPDAGKITMRGKVGALIALGAGFNPILTGRENIYISASVIGLSKQDIDQGVDKIIEFSELKEFIDMPVQSYSSGMAVRLGFAAASLLKPDILLLDEVLAVGDAGFRFKCYRMIDLLLESTAVIFVSHNMPDINRICTRTMLMSQGHPLFHGETQQGILAYESQNKNTNVATKSFINVHYPLSHFVIDAPKTVRFNDSYEFKIVLESSGPLKQLKLIVNFFNEAGEYACNLMTSGEEFGITVKPGLSHWTCRIERVPLKPATYQLAVHLLQNGAFVASNSRTKSVAVTDGFAGSNSDCVLHLEEWRQSG